MVTDFLSLETECFEVKENTQYLPKLYDFGGTLLLLLWEIKDKGDNSCFSHITSWLPIVNEDYYHQSFSLTLEKCRPQKFK